LKSSKIIAFLFFIYSLGRISSFAAGSVLAREHFPFGAAILHAAAKEGIIRSSSSPFLTYLGQPVAWELDPPVRMRMAVLF